MRTALALLLSLALMLLPAGVSAAANLEAARVTPAASCHETAGASHDQLTSKSHAAGRACAEHCLTQAVSSAPLAVAQQPAIANAISAERSRAVAALAPRGADPPATPPPRA